MIRSRELHCSSSHSELLMGPTDRIFVWCAALKERTGERSEVGAQEGGWCAFQMSCPRARPTSNDAIDELAWIISVIPPLLSSPSSSLSSPFHALVDRKKGKEKRSFPTAAAGNQLAAVRVVRCARYNKKKRPIKSHESISRALLLHWGGSDLAGHCDENTQRNVSHGTAMPCRYNP